MVVSLNYCSQNGGNIYRAPYYNGNPSIGPRIIGDLDQYPYTRNVPGTWYRKKGQLVGLLHCIEMCLRNFFVVSFTEIW